MDNYNYMQDITMNNPSKNLTSTTPPPFIIEQVPQKVSFYPTPEITPITIQKGTIKISQNVQVNVIDSNAFLTGTNNNLSISSGQKLGVNKKNFGKKKQSKQIDFFNSLEDPLTANNNTNLVAGDPSGAEVSNVANESSWFINEDDRVFRGQGFNTHEEDTCKLVKYLEKHFSKQDFYRYQTEESKNGS